MDKMKVISHISLLFDVKHMLFFFFFSSERSAKQFRQIGPNCKGKHRERSRNVAFSAFFFSLGLICRHYFVFVNPLPGFSVTVTVRHKKKKKKIGPSGAIGGLGHVLLLDCPEDHEPQNVTPCLSIILPGPHWNDLQLRIYRRKVSLQVSLSLAFPVRQQLDFKLLLLDSINLEPRQREARFGRLSSTSITLLQSVFSIQPSPRQISVSKLWCRSSHIVFFPKREKDI